MSTRQFLRSALALTLLASSTAALMSPLSAAAREGNSSTSTGHGIKCRLVAVVQPDGKIVYQQVCTKGV